MTTAQAATVPVINDFDEEDYDDGIEVIEEGDWTEDRKGILKKLTIDEIAEGIMRLQAEHPGEALNREELDKKIMRTMAGRQAKAVGA